MTSDVRRWWGGLQDKSRDGVDENNLHIKSQFVRRWRYQRNYTPAGKNDIHIPTMVPWVLELAYIGYSHSTQG